MFMEAIQKSLKVTFLEIIKTGLITDLMSFFSLKQHHQVYNQTPTISKTTAVSVNAPNKDISELPHLHICNPAVVK